jgi:CheY-like chemotaxis protein
MMEVEALRERSYRILVVDDDPAIRRILDLMLTRRGHTVSVASDGAAALRSIRGDPFDIVVTDLIMPDIEGLQLIREVRSMPSPPRIVAMSGGGRGAKHNYLEMAMHLGASAILAKPFTQDELVAVIAEAVRAPDARA